MRTIAIVAALFALGCKPGSSVVGTYHIEQENNFFGEGAEKIELEMGEDHNFRVLAGRLRIFEGTWKQENGMVIWSGSGAKLATSYKIDGNRLLPMIERRPVMGWRFVRK